LTQVYTVATNALVWYWFAGAVVVVAFAAVEAYLRMTRPRGPAAYD
jgi:hypothetical protein